MIYSHEVEKMCTVAQGVHHGAAPIPEEAKWVKSKQVADISGLTHGIGWCAPQQGACKLTLNVKEGIIQEALEYMLCDFVYIAWKYVGRYRMFIWNCHWSYIESGQFIFRESGIVFFQLL